MKQMETQRMMGVTEMREFVFVKPDASVAFEFVDHPADAAMFLKMHKAIAYGPVGQQKVLVEAVQSTLSQEASEVSVFGWYRCDAGLRRIAEPDHPGPIEGWTVKHADQECDFSELQDAERYAVGLADHHDCAVTYR